MMGLFEQKLREALEAVKNTDQEKDPRRERKIARTHYIKRKLTKEVKHYINNARIIKYKKIEQIQSKYGI